jgi:hypothetical protein
MYGPSCSHTPSRYGAWRVQCLPCKSKLYNEEFSDLNSSPYIFKADIWIRGRNRKYIQNCEGKPLESDNLEDEWPQ